MSEEITYIELDLRRCSNSYGQGTCTAALGSTGLKKCFNSFATCQDKDNFADEYVTVRYSKVTSTPPDIDAIPSVESVSIRPAMLELGESIGIRASVTINFKDHRSPDTGPDGDRYLASRSYDPYKQGTYWGKFRSRFPFVRGSKIRIIRGNTDQTLEQMETRHFIVDSVAGPNSNGSFTIKAKDALNLAKGKQAQIPVITKDELNTELLTASTVLEPVGNQYDYNLGEYLNLGGNEIVRVTAHISATNKLGVERAQFNTEAQDHKAGDRIQLCVYYSPQQVNAILIDLLVNYASIPASYIPTVDWEAETKAYIDRLYTGLIAEPMGVDKLINELLQQTASSLWWDDVAKLLRFRVLRAVDSSAATYNDDVIVGDTFSIKDQPEKRVSQVWTYYGQINPLEKLDDIKNYANTLVTVSGESEQDFNGEPAIKKIFSRWIASGSDTPSRLNDLILSRYTTPPRLIAFQLQKNSKAVVPELGGGYNCETWTLQNDEGSSETVPIQLLQVQSTDAHINVIGEEVLYSQTITPDDPTVKNVAIDNSRANLNLYSYVSASQSITSGDIFNIIIASGVIISSTLTSVPAFSTGTGWPTGVTINIVNNGKIIGRGGAGGNGGGIPADNSPLDGVDGGNGGDAMEFLYDVNITNNHEIGGGGGGGGGGGALHGASTGSVVGGSGGGSGEGIGGGGLGGVAIGGFGASDPNSHDGQNGSPSSSGSEGIGGISTIYNNPFGIIYHGGAGGAGGAAGVNGANGSVGGADIGAIPPVLSDGGTGGLAGAAIEKKGHTVVITNNGTIAGVINA